MQSCSYTLSILSKLELCVGMPTLSMKFKASDIHHSRPFSVKAILAYFNFGSTGIKPLDYMKIDAIESSCLNIDLVPWVYREALAPLLVRGDSNVSFKCQTETKPIMMSPNVAAV